MAYNESAKKGNIFILTKKGYEKTPYMVKHERVIGKPVEGFEYRVPVSWIKNGYVEQIPEPYKAEGE